MSAPSLKDYGALETCQRFVCVGFFFKCLSVLIMLQSVLYFSSTALPLLPHSSKIKYLSSYKSFICGGNQVLLQLNTCRQDERKRSQRLILSQITRVTVPSLWTVALRSLVLTFCFVSSCCAEIHRILSLSHAAQKASGISKMRREFPTHRVFFGHKSLQITLK